MHFSKRAVASFSDNCFNVTCNSMLSSLASHAWALARRGAISCDLNKFVATAATSEKTPAAPHKYGKLESPSQVTPMACVSLTPPNAEPDKAVAIALETMLKLVSREP